jgi:aspartyl-tRNA(Asn)/glutamyl-tRNA(Gln) amidotransferase subunit C
MADFDLSHLCRLAQIDLEGDEQPIVAADLAQIIHMVDRMQAVDTTGVEPLAHPVEGQQRLREDVVTEQVDRERYQAGAPAVEGGLYLVPRVVE